LIHCANCTLRPWEPADAESITALLGDHDVWINLGDRVPHPYKLEHAHQFIAFASAKSPTENFAIVVDDRAIGSVGIFPGEGMNRVSAEIGYWLGKPYWGRGIMTEAIKAMTKYAFENFQLTRIFALAFARNTGSIRALEKAGYVREGSLRQAVIKEGVVLDDYLYAS
jgi:RimJ/RimL family protein N-acetyltransferase